MRTSHYFVELTHFLQRNPIHTAKVNENPKGLRTLTEIIGIGSGASATFGRRAGRKRHTGYQQYQNQLR